MSLIKNVYLYFPELLLIENETDCQHWFTLKRKL